MQPLTVMRAAAWLGFVVVGWSLNVRWGASVDLPSGPPAQWERLVVGATLLSLGAALALSLSGRGGAPPSWLARGLAAAAGAGAVTIAFVLRGRAQSALGGPDSLLGGSGWTWLCAGAALVAASALATAALRAKKRRR
jgi:hypothetical protein